MLPWDHLSAGLHKDFLWQDWRDALEEVGLEDCRWTPCYDCGACTGYGIEHVVASAVPPAGGSQGTGQDLQWGGEVPVALLPATPGGGGGMKQRVRFAKRGKVRFLSHRDLARVWERALRRAGIRVAYSEGFSPRPRLSFGLALSTGYESLGEYLDIDLADDLEPDELVALVNPSLPTGMEAQAAIRIPPGTDSLQQAVTSSSWEIEVAGVDADAHRPGGARCPGGRRPPDRRRAQGERDRPRRPSGDPRPRRRRHHARSPSWPPNPAASAPRSCSERSIPRGPRARSSEPPMDVGRRRPLRADPLRGPRRTRRDVDPARGSACVMRRERTDDRDPHRRHRRPPRRAGRPHRRRRAPTADARRPPPALARRRRTAPTRGRPDRSRAQRAGTADAATTTARPPKRRRRGSRGGRNRSRPRPDGRRPAPTPGDDRNPELPDTPREGRPKSVEAADASLVRRPAAEARPQAPDRRLDARPVAAAGPRRRRRAPTPATARRSAAGAGRPRSRRRRRRQATRAQAQPARAAAPTGGRDARARRSRPCSPPAGIDLDDDVLEARRGRERKGRPVGRYLMCVHVDPKATQIAVLEGRALIEHYVSRPSDDVAQIHGNIYLGRVQNVLPGMEAAFVDIGTPEERRALPRRRALRRRRRRGRPKGKTAATSASSRC